MQFYGQEFISTADQEVHTGLNRLRSVFWERAADGQHCLSFRVRNARPLTYPILLPRKDQASSGL